MQFKNACFAKIQKVCLTRVSQFKKYPVIPMLVFSMNSLCVLKASAKNFTGNRKIERLSTSLENNPQFRIALFGGWWTSRKNFFTFFLLFEWNVRLSHTVVNFAKQFRIFFAPVEISWHRESIDSFRNDIWKKNPINEKLLRMFVASIYFTFNNEKFNKNASIRINFIDWTSASNIHLAVVQLCSMNIEFDLAQFP